MKSIAALLPPLGHGSGGLRTVVNLLGGLARRGHECHVYVEGNATEIELRQRLARFYDCDWLTPHAGFSSAGRHDLVLATMWHTAFSLAALPGNFKRVYLVQDYEPLFYPMGGHHLLAEFSYRQNLQVITMGRWLAEKLRRDFDIVARPLDFCADERIYRPRPKDVPAEFAIAAIFQPEKPHRATMICLEALRRLQRTLPHLRMYTFGSTQVPTGLHCIHPGIVPPAVLNRIYSHCLAGLCVSLTNPSRVPFEMLASGLPVVEAHRENNFFDLPPRGALLTDLDADAIKNALLELVLDAQRREAERQAGLAFMAARPATFEQEQFCGYIDDILANRAARKQAVALPKREPFRRPTVPTPRRGEPRPAFDLLTVDVWDTLLRRRCHPDEIKLFTARYLQLTRWPWLKPACADAYRLMQERVQCELALGRQCSRGGGDDEYHIHDVFTAWVASVLAVPPPPVELKRIADELVAVEMAQERRCIYADAGIAARLDSIPAKRRLFLSDFYMSAAPVRALLAHAGMEAVVPDGFTSCDVSLNKRSGRFFKKIQKDLGVSAGRHAHVGDNEYSDYFVPRSLGMTAVHFESAAEAKTIVRYREEFQLRTEAATPVPSGATAKAPEKKTGTKEGKNFCPGELRPEICLEALANLDDVAAMEGYGAAISPMFVGFAVFIAEEAIKAGLDRVYFFTREGEFFARLYAAVAATDPLGVPFPEPVVLEVSRLATFAASLRRFDAAEFMRLWNMYPTQSLRNFFVSLDLDPAPAESILAAHDLKLDEAIRQPWKDSRVGKLLADTRFTGFLADAIAEKRSLLLDYLKSKGIAADAAKIGVVDIGWRGTIQDNLAWVLPGTAIHGWYFGLLPFLNPQPPNAVKTAFGPGRAGDAEETRRLLEFVSPLEMLCNSESGSTLRYGRNGAAVVACRASHPHEEEIYRRYSRHFQSGVLSRVGPVSDVVRQRAMSPAELRPLALELLASVVHDPPKVVADAYFSLNHNETFGAGAFDDKQRHRGRIQFARGLYDAGAVEEFEKELRDTTWPQGFARLCGIEYPFFGRDNRSPRELPLEIRRAARLAGVEAMRHFRERRWDESRAAALRALALDPWRLKSHYLLYRTCLEQNRTREALQRFRLIRLVDLNHAPSLNEFAVRSFKADVKAPVEKLLENIVEEHPGYRPAQLNLCRLYLGTDRPLKALGLLDKAIEQFGDAPEFLQFRAAAQILAGRAALADAAAILDRLPKNQLSATPWLAGFKTDSLPQDEAFLAGALAHFIVPMSDDDYLGLKTPLVTIESSSIAAPAVSTKAPAPLASIVVLVHNQLEHTRKCIDSLFAHTRAPFELIVVDNGSSDGTGKFLGTLRREWANVRVIANRTNRGFAAGNNQGLAIAKGEFIVLLNNDTLVTPGWLDGLGAALEGDARCGLVGPVSNCVSGPQQIATNYSNDAAMFEFAKSWSAQSGGQSELTNRLVGFCLMFKRAVLDAIGGLDECFGSGNFEDDDFCLRAKFAGFSSRIARGVFIHHTGSQTFRGTKIDYRQAMMRNWDLFRAKWNLPANVALEKGYPIPTAKPDAVAVKVALPSLNLTHKLVEDVHWLEEMPAAIPAKTESAPVARLGDLAEARKVFEVKEWEASWNATVAAIQVRPFHPEAFLLLAEIALAIGDRATAKACAQRARDLAPNWKATKQFLKKHSTFNIHHSTPNATAFDPASILHPLSAPRLSVCLIVKNEEKFLPQCLASIKPVADQIVVVDTGSTDRTVAIAKEQGAEVHSFAWCDDFAAARNAALEHATGDWVLILDADEELPSTEQAKLKADLRRSDVIAFRLPLVDKGDEAHGCHCVPRLFRNAPGVFYRGRIHEQVFPSLIAFGKRFQLKTAVGTAQLLHHGYAPEIVRDRNKVERNLKLLRQAVVEDPLDANLQMNLGLELVHSGRLEEGLVHYREAFRLMSAQPPTDLAPELREVLLTQLTCHLYKVHAHDEIVQALQSPLAKQSALSASLHFALGLALFELKRFPEAADAMRQCLARRREPSLAPINTDILTAVPQHCLALALMKSGDAAGAEKAFRSAMTESGPATEAKLDYARFLSAQNRPVEALQQLNELVFANCKNGVAWRLGGEIALGKPEFLEFARDWTGEAIKQLPDDAVIIAQRGEALMLSQQMTDALPLWTRAVNGEHPPRAVAAEILCATAVGTDAFASAAEKFKPELQRNEGVVSRAFIEWYSRLVKAGARDAVVRLNSRVDSLRPLLPSAAGVLDGVIAAAGKAGG